MYRSIRQNPAAWLPLREGEKRCGPALLNLRGFLASTAGLNCTVSGREMSSFDSLTLAVEDWFATPLRDLPDALRQRVEKEFAPMPWDQLSADQRRTVTLQLDYQHDPATKHDRQFWWDHYQHQVELKAQIARWEAAATPTAGELALSEARLKELRQELARSEAHKGQARDDYHPVSKPLDGDTEASPISPGSPVQYVAYPKAMAQLRKQLDTTPEELAAWIWAGPKYGGIAAYVNANELDPPQRFYFGLGTGEGDDHDYVSPLMACWFRADEIARFNPADRYITGEALIKRWGERPGLRAEAWVRAKIEESRLCDLHPIYGFTQGTSRRDADYPPLAVGLFKLSEVQKIEAEDFADDRALSSSAARSMLMEVGVAAVITSTVAAVSDPGCATLAMPTVTTGGMSDTAKERPERIAQGSKSADDTQIVSSGASACPAPMSELELGSREWRKQKAQTAANARHDQPGGSRDKKRQIREAWASGKFATRSICAEQECAALGIAYATAVKALRNTPDPTRG